jgi:hypothetical protein
MHNKDFSDLPPPNIFLETQENIEVKLVQSKGDSSFEEEGSRVAEKLRDKGHPDVATIILVLTFLISIFNKLSLETKFQKKMPLAVPVCDKDLERRKNIHEFLIEMRAVADVDRVELGLFHYSENGLNTEMSIFDEALAPGASSLLEKDNISKNVNITKIQEEINRSRADYFTFLSRDAVDPISRCAMYLDSVGIHGSVCSRIVLCNGDRVGILELQHFSRKENILEDKDTVRQLDQIFNNLINALEHLLLGKKGVLEVMKSIIIF